MSARRVLLAAVTGVVVFGLAWELFVRVFDVEPFILLPPSEIVAELFERPRFYAEAAAVTGYQAASGLLISLAVTLVIGSLLAAWRFLEQAAQPVLVLILVAPWVAYFSSILVWLGRGDPPVIFLVAFVCMPVFVFAAVAGLRSADPAARELLASVDASRVEVLWRLRLPAAVPSLLATARSSRRWRSPPRTSARAATCRTRASERSGRGRQRPQRAAALGGDPGDGAPRRRRAGVDHAARAGPVALARVTASTLVADALTPVRSSPHELHGRGGPFSLPLRPVVRWQIR